MSKKQKNKANKPSVAKQQATASSKAVVDDQLIQRVKELKDATGQKFDESGLAPYAENEEVQPKIAEAEEANSIKKYLKELEEIHRQLIPLKQKADELMESAKSDSEKVKEEREKLESDKIELNRRIQSTNVKEKEILERELQLDNGEYTGTIRSLINTLSNSEKEIADETKKLLDDITRRQIDILQKEKELGENTLKLEEDKLRLEKEKKQVERQKKNLETDRKIYQEEAREELESEFTLKYEDAKSSADRLRARNQALESQLSELNDIRRSFFATFGDADPKDILAEVAKIKDERAKLKEELDQRPTLDDLETQRKEKSLLQAEVTRLKGMVDEKEIAQLRTFINNADSYVIEIQGYKDRLESAQNREDSLRRTIDDLKSTVDQLKGEHQKDEEAFQSARKYDADPSLQEKCFRDITPRSMAEFANYMQRKIASSEKPFYYDIDTIRIFIAGLNMSNISILQGISGTGKTSLPREFAKAIISDAPLYSGNNKENSPNAPYRICAVQSGWRDNMDLMGYYNSFEHKYKETEFFKALYLANQRKYSDTLFFIILDEMNLSRPEHYFADFLSLLEQDATERFITVNAPDEVLPRSIVQGKLRVPENVRFIGTANHDETTLEFAPKTYDRSNLMEMPKNQARNIERTEDNYNVSYTWLKQQFAKAKSAHHNSYIQFKKFINSDDMKYLLADKGIGVGNRFEDQAERFITTFIETGAPQDSSNSLAKAADHLITTRLFRTLKNRYDIEKSNMQTFKEEFDGIFKKSFGVLPSYADALLNEEIDKK